MMNQKQRKEQQDKVIKSQLIKNNIKLYQENKIHYLQYFPIFVERRKRKANQKINLTVSSLSQVVYFCYEQQIISNKDYHCYLYYNSFARQKSFIQKFAHNKLNQYQFKRARFTLLDHRRLSEMLINFNQNKYCLSDKVFYTHPNIVLFLTQIYKLSHFQYYSICNQVDGSYNLKWWKQINKMAKITYQNCKMHSESNQIFSKDSQVSNLLKSFYLPPKKSKYKTKLKLRLKSSDDNNVKQKNKQDKQKYIKNIDQVSKLLASPINQIQKINFKKSILFMNSKNLQQENQNNLVQNNNPIQQKQIIDSKQCTDLFTFCQKDESNDQLLSMKVKKQQELSLQKAQIVYDKQDEEQYQQESQQSSQSSASFIQQQSHQDYSLGQLLQNNPPQNQKSYEMNSIKSKKQKKQRKVLQKQKDDDFFSSLEYQDNLNQKSDCQIKN